MSDGKNTIWVNRMSDIWIDVWLCTKLCVNICQIHTYLWCISDILIGSWGSCSTPEDQKMSAKSKV